MRTTNIDHLRRLSARVRVRALHPFLGGLRPAFRRSLPPRRPPSPRLAQSRHPTATPSPRLVQSLLFSSGRIRIRSRCRTRTRIRIRFALSLYHRTRPSLPAVHMRILETTEYTSQQRSTLPQASWPGYTLHLTSYICLFAYLFVCATYTL